MHPWEGGGPPALVGRHNVSPGPTRVHQPLCHTLVRHALVWQEAHRGARQCVPAGLRALRSVPPVQVSTSASGGGRRGGPCSARGPPTVSDAHESHGQVRTQRPQVESGCARGTRVCAPVRTFVVPRLCWIACVSLRRARALATGGAFVRSDVRRARDACRTLFGWIAALVCGRLAHASPVNQRVHQPPGGPRIICPVRNARCNLRGQTPGHTRQHCPVVCTRSSRAIRISVSSVFAVSCGCSQCRGTAFRWRRARARPYLRHVCPCEYQWCA